ncbi:MAG: PadR family transcriptional regulator, partial [Solirubrobacterales bacterium]|nr:PadR family transcriptional regulator [Solirubrobacterales bacterium]
GSGSADPLVGDLRRGGLLPLLVLHFLAREPSYGQRLMDGTGSLMGVTVNPNTMYPLLRSLEDRGFIDGDWEHPHRRTRRYYRLTTSGDDERARLAAELEPRLDAIAGRIADIRAELRRA